MGLNAGADVLTINFTPLSFRVHYNIYARDRFVVTLRHAINTAKTAGLKVNSKVQLNKAASNKGWSKENG
jgi:biotin synthase